MKNKSPGFWTACFVIAVGCLGFVQRLSGLPINWILFYITCAAAVDAIAGPKAGILMSAFATIVWVAGGGVNLSAGIWGITTWNILTGFALILSANFGLWLWRKTPQQVSLAARTDALTTLLNRPGFVETAQHEVARCRRHKRVFSLVCIDVDEFKTVNKDYSHAVGDDVLQLIGKTLKNGVRTSDYAAHLEADVFMLLLPEMDSEMTRMAVARIVKLVQEAMISTTALTIRAIGMTFVSSPTTPEAFLTQMDKLRYMTKAADKATIKIQEI